MAGQDNLHSKHLQASLRGEFIDAVVAGAELPDRGVLRSLFVPRLYRIHSRRKVAIESELAAPLGQCIPGIKEFAVDPDGSIHICINMPRRYAIGDVRQGLAASKAGMILERFCEVLDENCRECWAVRFCGMCLVSIGNMGNGADGWPSPVWCQEERESLTDALRLYATILERNPKALDTFFAGHHGANAKPD
jgi:uncharacterized protein